MSDNLVLKLNNGSDVMEGLERFAAENNIVYGVFVDVRGKVKDIDLVSHGLRGSIIGTKAEGVFGLDAISGQMQRLKNGSYNIVLRVAISSSGFTGKEGQLINGKASGPLEITVQKKDVKKIIEA